MTHKELPTATILKDGISITAIFHIMSIYNDKERILPTAEIVNVSSG